MPSDLVAFKPSPDSDPDGAKLRSILTAHLATDHAHGKRVLLVHWVAALSIPLWLLSAWPGWIATSTRRFFLLIWVLSAGAALVALVREWRWRRKRDSAAAGLSAGIPLAPAPRRIMQHR